MTICKKKSNPASYTDFKSGDVKVFFFIFLGYESGFAKYFIFIFSHCIIINIYLLKLIFFAKNEKKQVTQRNEHSFEKNAFFLNMHR